MSLHHLWKLRWQPRCAHCRPFYHSTLLLHMVHFDRSRCSWMVFHKVDQQPGRQGWAEFLGELSRQKLGFCCVCSHQSPLWGYLCVKHLCALILNLPKIAILWLCTLSLSPCEWHLSRSVTQVRAAKRVCAPFAIVQVNWVYTQYVCGFSGVL